MRPGDIASRLAMRAEWRYSRSSGPGGQHRDHAETRAALTVRAEHLDALPSALAVRLRAALGLDARPLRLSSQIARERERNREIVVARLAARVAAALAPPPPARRPSAPTRAARERRLAEKVRRASLKASRRPPAGED